MGSRLLGTVTAALIAGGCLVAIEDAEQQPKSDASSESGGAGGSSGITGQDASAGSGGASGSSGSGGASGSSGSGGTSGSSGSGGGAGAAPVVNVQHGSASVVAGSIDAPIKPVDLGRSVLLFGKRHTLVSPVNFQIKGELAESAISFHRVGSFGTVDIEWHVLEHEALKVRRGAFTLTSTQQSISIGAPLPLAKSFVLLSHSAVGESFGDDDLFAAELLDDTTLRISAATYISSANMAWQIVEFTDATTVHSGKSVIAADAKVSSSKLAQSVDLGRSFLVFSYKTVGAVTTAPTAQLAVRGRLSDTTTVSFDRELEGAVGLEIAWFVIQLGAGFVQTQSLAFSPSAMELSPALTQFEPARSVPLASAFGWAGKASAANQGTTGEAHVTLAFGPGQSLVARRESAQDMANIEAFVASF
jgi:hypothetical protein